MRVDLLVSPGCSAREETERLIRRVLSTLAPSASLQIIEVDSQQKARALKFPGSPTVRVNGRDLEPDVQKSFHFGLG